jgi:thioredoxin 1
MLNLDHAFAVSDESFQAEVAEVEGLVMVDFTADWCPPCRMLAPLVEQVAASHAGTLRVGVLDMDANPATVARYQVRAAPTLLFLRQGVEVGRVVGAVPRARIEAEIERLA